jgi:Alkaline phosphatase PhoX
MRKGRVQALVAVSAVAVGVAAAMAGAAIQPIKRYAVPLPDSGYETTRLLSVGDTVPMTGNPAKQYQMVGIPDGTGAHRNHDGTRTIYMNHELPVSPTLSMSQPIIGDPLNRGAIVSKLIVDKHGNVLSGDRAYDVVYDESVANPAAQPAPDTTNTTRPFSRFCSATLVGPDEGFDRYIYMPNEEEGTEANTFDGKGGVAVAIFDNELHTLPKLGRFAWENTVPQSNAGSRTVVMGMEDGPFAVDPAVENSQVYMYVGTKDTSPGASVLDKNGLDNGFLYVLAPVDPAQRLEPSFGDESGAIPVKWVLVPNADSTTEAQLEAASDAAGAINFARPEDGAWNKRHENEYFFVTTGGLAGGNELGRLYSLHLDPENPIAPGTLSVVYEADDVIADGGDIAISPDNIDTSNSYLMINEDGTTESRVVMAAKGRDGSIWRFKLKGGPGSVGVDVDSAERIAELDPPGQLGGGVVNPGIWETSGITDTSRVFGGGTWIFDVQAHPPTAVPGLNTIEDGQLLLLSRSGEEAGGD